MGDLSARNFGLLIAYVLPGFVALFGVGCFSGTVRLWLLGGTTPAGPTLGGAFFVVVASIFCGMTASALRWAVLDQIHHRTGLLQPLWNDAKLADHLEAFDYLVEHHYRYYQFYGNSAVALLCSFGAWRLSDGSTPVGLPELAVLVLTSVFVAGSRDALRKYYSGTSLLLGTLTKETDDDERTTQSREDGDVED